MTLTTSSTSLLALILKNSLNQNSKKQKQNFTELASGISESQLTSKIETLNSLTSGIEANQTSVQNASSLLESSSEAAVTSQDILNQMRDLSVQASSDILSNSERQSLNDAFENLKQEFNRTVSNFQFNNTKTLDGSFANKTIQVGANSGDQIQMSIDDLRSDAIGISGINLTSQSESQSAISSLDSALDQVSQNIAKMGSQQNRLDSIMESNANDFLQASQAKSQLQDLDFAKGIQDFTQNSMQQEMIVKLFEKNNTQNESTLSLVI